MRLLQPCLPVALLIALSSLAVAQTETRLAIGEPNKPKHNQVIAEFPGHRYSLEIAVKPVKEMVNGEERSIPTVFAYVSDAHFEPLLIEAKEIRLNFIVDRQPKSFVLLPAKAEANAKKDTKPQSIFELKSPELAKLISDGWQETAQASMVVGKTPYTARMVKVKDYTPHRH